LGSSDGLGEGWVNLFQSYIVVAEHERLTRELLSIKGHINTILQVAVLIILTWFQLGYLATDFAVFVETLGAGPILGFNFRSANILFIIVIKACSNIYSTSLLGGLVERRPRRFILSKLTCLTLTLLLAWLETYGQILDA